MVPDVTTRLRQGLAERYEIELGPDGTPVVLGAGGMATVFRARDLRHDREVALKVLRPEIGATVGSERFLREIRVTARLQHPNILPLHDSGECDALLYYVMPLVEGESLRQRLARDGRLPIPVAIRIAREVADALDYAHRHGVLHRDVKPENVLLAEGRVMLADFGIAQALTGGQAGGSTGGPTGGQEIALTATGLSIGTPAYMSPEQAAGVRDLDARSDVYAVGCVLYEMLAGAPPFSGGSAAALIAARFAGDPPPLRTKDPAVSSALEGVVTRALARDPVERFATAAELVRALDAVSASDTRVAPAMPVVAAAVRFPRVRGWAGISVGLLLLVVLAAVVVRVIRTGPASRTVGPVTLAVLPFRDLSAPGETTALGMGIPDAIITRMSGIRALRVRPTAAILRYENRAVDPQQAGRELGADYVLAGTVQQAGPRIRVGVQLMRVADDTPAWASRYDLDRADLLGLQDSIARRVGTALEIRISAAEERRLYRRYTDNVEAYELFLRGRAQLARLTREATLAAVAAFERALVLDSAYTPARAGLAMASADMHLRFASGDDVKQWGERAQREARRALELDSTIADAHLAMAAVARKTDFNWEETLEASRRALALNPSLELAHQFRAAAFYHLGLLPQASAELAAAAEINPEPSVEQIRTEGVIAFFSGDFTRAARLGDEVRRASGEQVADFYRAEAYLYAGDSVRGRSVLDSLVVSPSASGRARGTAVLAALVAGHEPARARALVDTLLASGYLDHHVAYSLATAFAQLGEPATAVRWLERAAREGFACYPWIVRDPLLDPIRADPGFARWLAAARGRWEVLQKRYPLQ